MSGPEGRGVEDAGVSRQHCAHVGALQSTEGVLGADQQYFDRIFLQKA
jgi:hypothetical protein